MDEEAEIPGILLRISLVRRGAPVAAVASYQPDAGLGSLVGRTIALALRLDVRPSVRPRELFCVENVTSSGLWNSPC